MLYFSQIGHSIEMCGVPRFRHSALTSYSYTNEYFLSEFYKLIPVYIIINTFKSSGQLPGPRKRDADLYYLCGSAIY